jgi:hypothetical protein
MVQSGAETILDRLTVNRRLQAHFQDIRQFIKTDVHFGPLKQNLQMVQPMPT